MTDQLGQSQVIPYLSGLSKLGFEISLISTEKKDNFFFLKKNIESLLQEASITWYPVMYTKKPPVLSTLRDMYVIFNKAKQLHRSSKFDIIHCRSYVAALIGLRLKERTGSKLIFDMRGFWADERIESKIWNINNPVYRTVYNFFKKKEKTLLKNSDAIISLTENAKKIILDWKLKNSPLSITVIPCCCDTELFSNKNVPGEKKQKLATDLKIAKNDFVLSYLGALGTWYLLDEMLDCFKSLKEIKPGSKFLFITGHSGEEIFARAKSRNIAAEDIIVTKSPRNEVPLLLSLSDASIFFYQPTFSHTATSPTKQAEIMCLGIPIIYNKGIGDTDQIIESANAGIGISDFTRSEYESAWSKILNTTFDKGKIREKAVAYFDLKRGVQLYASVYNEVLKS